MRGHNIHVLFYEQIRIIIPELFLLPFLIGSSEMHEQKELAQISLLWRFPIAIPYT